MRAAAVDAAHDFRIFTITDGGGEGGGTVAIGIFRAVGGSFAREFALHHVGEGQLDVGDLFKGDVGLGDAGDEAGFEAADGLLLTQILDIDAGAVIGGEDFIAKFDAGTGFADLLDEIGEFFGRGGINGKIRDGFKGRFHVDIWFVGLRHKPKLNSKLGDGRAGGAAGGGGS